jgi:hypothetical protein
MFTRAAVPRGLIPGLTVIDSQNGAVVPAVEIGDVASVTSKMALRFWPAHLPRSKN